MAVNRRQARVLAVQAFYHHEFHRDEVLDALRELADDADADLGTRDYASRLCRWFVADEPRIDALIASVLQERTLKRVELLGRIVLRLGTAELLGGETPPKVVIDEAIEIARLYGSPDTAKFVNGVLDAVMRRIAEGA
ncbi:MAG: transcription antitermination factor NusB [Phycisphaerales bacterium]|nr:transcription antitermination factor NusB [Phycisphaerales bacterium]